MKDCCKIACYALLARLDDEMENSRWFDINRRKRRERNPVVSIRRWKKILREEMERVNEN